MTHSYAVSKGGGGGRNGERAPRERLRETEKAVHQGYSKQGTGQAASEAPSNSEKLRTGEMALKLKN